MLLAVGACGFHPGVAPGDSNVANDVAADVAAIDAPPAKCLGLWCRRKAIALHGAVGGPHVDFPIVIDLASDADVAAAARADGFDLLFADAAGTKLAYERCAFKAMGRLLAWVKVPSLTAKTVIYLYYGNTAATDQAQPMMTWSAGYQGVWHLETPTPPYPDSSGHSNTATVNAGVTAGANGALGKAAQLAASKQGFLTMMNSASLDSTASAGTFEALLDWTNAASGSYQFIMTSSNRFGGTFDGFEWASQGGGAHYFYPWADPAQNDYNLGPNPFTNGAWHHAAVTLDFATTAVILYVDGAPIPLTTVNVPATWTQVANPANWLWGGNPGYSGTVGYFDGMMDELRVASVVRSADWIATAAANQLVPASFYTLGPEEMLVP